MYNSSGAADKLKVNPSDIAKVEKKDVAALLMYARFLETIENSTKKFIKENFVDDKAEKAELETAVNKFYEAEWAKF